MYLQHGEKFDVTQLVNGLRLICTMNSVFQGFAYLSYCVGYVDKLIFNLINLQCRCSMLVAVAFETPSVPPHSIIPDREVSPLILAPPVVSG